LGGRQYLLATEPRELPNPSEGERFQILATKAIRLLAVIALLPFIEASSGNETSPLGESFPE
jgi:hypothetical protein